MNSHPSHPRPPVGAKERILLVDDEPAVRKVVRVMLERLGYKVLEATNGADALGIIETSIERIDLILTDVVMPELHGGDLGESVLSREPWRRVLYMSGYAGDDLTLRGLAQAGTALLKKPFTPEALASAVREVLDRESPSSS